MIGVGVPKGSVFGQSQDNYVAIPDQTYFKIYGDRAGMQYNFAAFNRDHLEEAEDEIRTLVRSYRHLRPQQDDTFGIQSSDTLVSTWDLDRDHRRSGRWHRERVHGGGRSGHHEHHAGRGHGAYPRNRRAQKRGRAQPGHPESVPGGILDALRHRRIDRRDQRLCILAFLVNNFTPVPMEVPLNAIVLGVGLSAMVGLFFGIYPARRAARLDPIVALRAEA